MTQDTDLDLVNIREKKNPFKWEKVVNGLPVKSLCGFFRPWVYKERIYGSIADDMFICVDDGWPIGPTEVVCWEASIKWGSTSSRIGIQDLSRKVQGLDPGRGR